MGNKKESITNTDLVKNVAKKISELNQIEEIEDLLKNNFIKFEHKKDKYKVRIPTIKEREEVRGERTRKYYELLEDNRYKLKEVLIKIYKEKQNIDIEQIEDDIIKLQSQINDLRVKAITSKDKKTQKTLRDEIEYLLEKQTDLSIKKRDLLQYSIEEELVEYCNYYLTYLVLEKEINNKWEKVFTTYDDFSSSLDNELILKAVNYLSLLIQKTEF
jgi:hypothetical protein